MSTASAAPAAPKPRAMPLPSWSKTTAHASPPSNASSAKNSNVSVWKISTTIPLTHSTKRNQQVRLPQGQNPNSSSETTDPPRDFGRDGDDRKVQFKQSPHLPQERLSRFY